jgi:hypothetical protein
VQLPALPIAAVALALVGLLGESAIALPGGDLGSGVAIHDGVAARGCVSLRLRASDADPLCSPDLLRDAAQPRDCEAIPAGICVFASFSARAFGAGPHELQLLVDCGQAWWAEGERFEMALGSARSYTRFGAVPLRCEGEPHAEARLILDGREIASDRIAL